MKYAAPIRQQLGFRTIFNLLGPLTNPAMARRQVVGVYDRQLTEPIARVLQNLDSEHVMVVHGSGMDELTTLGPSHITHLQHGRVHSYDLDPADLGLARADEAGLRVSSPQDSAAVLKDVLAGKQGPQRDIVLLNAAAALVVADVAADLRDGLQIAGKAIDSAAAKHTLERLVSLTQADAG